MTKTRKDSQFKPINTKKYELYVIWRTLPPIFKNNSREIQDRLGLTEDDKIAELLGLRTKGEFIKKYNVTYDTLRVWDKHLEDNFTSAELKKFFRKHLGNILGSAYKKLLAKGDAAEARLLLEWLGELDAEDKPIQVEIIIPERVAKIYATKPTPR